MNIYKKIYKDIAVRYLKFNYSYSFIKRMRIYVPKNITETKGGAEIICKATGNSFFIEVDLKKKTIIHKGVYGLNRNAPIEKIIL